MNAMIIASRVLVLTASSLLTLDAAGDQPQPEVASQSIRRVVTETVSGHSRIASDEHLPIEGGRAGSPIGGRVLWTDPATASVGTKVEPSVQAFPPRKGEATFLILTVAPGAATGMHATDTIDQFYLIDGELELVLEQGPPVLLHAGDSVVVHGDEHNWHNPGSTSARAIITSVGALRTARPPRGDQ